MLREVVINEVFIFVLPVIPKESNKVF